MLIGRKNPLGVMDDPVKGLLLEALSTLDYNYIIKEIDVERGENELRVSVVMKPRRDDATISTWRIIEMEERITSVLGLEPDLSHSRVGVTPEGFLLVVYVFRIRGIRPVDYENVGI